MPIKRQSKLFKVVLFFITFSPKRYIRNLKLFLVTINSCISQNYVRHIAKLWKQRITAMLM